MKSASCNEAIKIVGLRINWCDELATYLWILIKKHAHWNPTVYFNSYTK